MDAAVSFIDTEESYVTPSEWPHASKVGTISVESKGCDVSFVYESVTSMVSCFDVPVCRESSHVDVPCHPCCEVTVSFLDTLCGPATAIHCNTFSGPAKNTGNCLNNSHL